MRVEMVEICGLSAAIRQSKYPMALEPMMVNSAVTEGVDARGRISKAGTGHDNFLKGITLNFDLTFTNKAWIEAERYGHFTIVSSQSTMHKLTKMKLSYVEEGGMFNAYVDSAMVKRMQELQEDYNLEDDPDKKKEKYLTLLYSCPSGIELTAGISTNYMQLKTIYKQRHDHRLPEWREFCKWIETLPHSEWLTSLD